jgi:predicted RNase H-like HicB family nuclease
MIYYPFVVYYTEEDDGYFAVVPDLPGCTAH